MLDSEVFRNARRPEKYVTVDSGNVGEKASYSVEKAEEAPEKSAYSCGGRYCSASSFLYCRNYPGLFDGGWLWHTSQGAVRACAQIKCEDVWVTGTEDKNAAFSFSGAAKVAMLGKTFDQRLFSNTYAILSAWFTNVARVLFLWLMIRPLTTNYPLPRLSRGLEYLCSV